MFKDVTFLQAFYFGFAVTLGVICAGAFASILFAMLSLLIQFPLAR